MFDNGSIPVEDYISALNGLKEKQRCILVAQFLCPKHEFSAGQLARLIGSSHHVTGNSLYGKIAHAVCNHLNIKQPDKYWFVAISYAYHNEKEWIWAMHPNLAKAIVRLGWHKRDDYQKLFSSP